MNARHSLTARGHTTNKTQETIQQLTAQVNRLRETVHAIDTALVNLRALALETVRVKFSDDAPAALLEWAVTEIQNLRGAMQADDRRLRDAGIRVGIVSGCDTADAMADEILMLRAQRDELQGQVDGRARIRDSMDALVESVKEFQENAIPLLQVDASLEVKSIPAATLWDATRAYKGAMDTWKTLCATPVSDNAERIAKTRAHAWLEVERTQAELFAHIQTMETQAQTFAPPLVVMDEAGTIDAELLFAPTDVVGMLYAEKEITEFVRPTHVTNEENINE